MYIKLFFKKQMLETQGKLHIVSFTSTTAMQNPVGAIHSKNFLTIVLELLMHSRKTLEQIPEIKTSFPLVPTGNANAY